MWKELKRFDVSLPVYDIQSVVNYQAIRQPSVFEGMLLNLAVKYKNMLGQFSLSQVCEKFKIEAFLLQKALYSLIENEMLERCDTDLNVTHVQHLVVTTLGKDLYYKNEMPSENKKEEVKTIFHPLLNCLVKKDQFKLKAYDVNESNTLTTTLFEANNSHVSQLVEEMLAQTTEKQFDWKKPNTNISEINSAVLKHFAHRLPMRIALNDQGHLGLDANGKHEVQQAFNTWLTQSNPEVVWEHILAKTFQQVDNDLPEFEWSNVLDMTLAENTLLDGSALIRIYAEKSPNKLNDKPEIILSAHAKLAKVQGKTLTLPYTMALPEGFQALYFYKDQTATLVLKGNTHIFYAKQPRLVALQIKLDDEHVWSSIKTEVMRWNSATTLDVFAFTRYFLSEHEVIQHAPKLSMKDALSLHEAMKKANSPGLRASTWLDKIEKISNFNELKDFRSTFSHLELAPQWAEPLFFAKLLDDAFDKGQKAGTTLDQAFVNIVQIQKSLKSQINPDVLNPNQKINSNSLSKINIKALALIDEWLDCYEELQLKHTEILSLCERLQKQQRHLVVLKQGIAQSFAPLRTDVKPIAVLDTSYLMRHSDDLTNLERDYFVVIPQVVLHELDGLKKGQDGDNFSEQAQQARRAIRAIENLTSEHIEPTHDEFVTIIAKSKTAQEMSADEQILSVALFYRFNSSELFSLDKNMGNLAKAVNIRTTSEYQPKSKLIKEHQ